MPFDRDKKRYRVTGVLLLGMDDDVIQVLEATDNKSDIVVAALRAMVRNDGQPFEVPPQRAAQRKIRRAVARLRKANALLKTAASNLEQADYTLEGSS